MFRCPKPETFLGETSKAFVDSRFYVQDRIVDSLISLVPFFFDPLTAQDCPRVGVLLDTDPPDLLFVSVT